MKFATALLAAAITLTAGAAYANEAGPTTKTAKVAYSCQQGKKITVKYGSQTKGIVKVLGKGALRSVKVLRKTTELMIGLIASLISGLASLVSTYNLIRTSKRALTKAV